MTNNEKMLSSLKKINDFPFYTCCYYGDYKLDSFISGSIRSGADVVSVFEELFAAQGIPHTIAFSDPRVNSPACSAFFCGQPDDNVIVGKNLDWKRGPILLLKTAPRNGFKSVSVVDLLSCDIFGIGSFNHSLTLAPYIPFDGMNEAGLIVTMLSVHDTSTYQNNRQKKTIGDFNLIRVLLDTCGNVDEAIRTINEYSIVQTGPLPIHYLMADREKACVVELIDGEIVCTVSKANTYLTNRLVSGEKRFSANIDTCDRFAKMHEALSGKDKKITEKEAKSLLQKISVKNADYQPPSTIWSVLFRPREGSIKIRPGDSTNYYRVSL